MPAPSKRESAGTSSLRYLTPVAITIVLACTISPSERCTRYGRASQLNRTAVRAMATSAPNFSAWVSARPASANPEIPVGNPR